MANEPNIVLTPATWARLEKTLNYVEGQMRTKIPGGSNTPWGPVFPTPFRKKPIPISGQEDDDPWIWVWLWNRTQDGTNKRWKYSWKEVQKSGQGWPASNTGSWSIFSGNRVGPDDTWDYAYNIIEDSNDNAVSVYGNGVTVSDIPSGFDIVPFPSEFVTLARIVHPVSDNPDITLKPELWFSYSNGITGNCT